MVSVFVSSVLFCNTQTQTQGCFTDSHGETNRCYAAFPTSSTNSDNTRSNRVKIIKTPGGNLRYLHIKKAAGRPKCGECGIALAGIPTLRARELATVSRPTKTVQRAYGGSLCANCVKDRVVRAFLIEEQKIVKTVLKETSK